MAILDVTNNKSIAVLPFDNISNNHENDYFTDGITDEIINALTKVKGLKVIGRTSTFAFKNKQIDIKHIANKLNVSTILKGSARFQKNKVRITIQLIKTEDGHNLWSQKFDRNLDDIFDLQDEISLIIAEQIRENFGHLNIAEHLSTIGTKSLGAYKHYLKGRFYQLNWNLPDYLKAIDSYKKSLEIDPNFTDALFAISRSYGILTSWGFFDKTKGETTAINYLNRGQNIDSNSHWYYFSKASLCFWNSWKYEEGIQYLKKALDLNPNFAVGHEGIAEIYMAYNKIQKAHSHIDKALEINPLSPNHHFIKGNIFFLQKNYEKAISYMEETLKIDSNFSLAIETKLACFILLNDKKRFDTYINETPQLIKPEVCKQLFNFINYKIKPDKAPVDISDSFKSIYPWEFYLLIHGGNIPLALHIIKDKFKNKYGQLINYKLDPFLDSLRTNKQFKNIEKEIQDKTNKDFVLETKNVTTNNSLLDSKQIDYYQKSLIKNLEQDKVFLESTLPLKKLASLIELHPNKLSWLINECFDKNYNDFINSYRLAYFKQIALLPKNKNITLLGLAYDSGFNSKTVFNTYFKKETGLTPKAWLKTTK